MRFAKIVDAEGSAVIAILQNGHAYKVSKSAKASIADIMRDLVSGDLVSRLPKCTEVQYAAKSLLRPIDDDARIIRRLQFQRSRG